MATTIITKHGTGVPSSLQVGELAIDKAEPAIYTNTGSGVEKIATASSGGGGGVVGNSYITDYIAPASIITLTGNQSSHFEIVSGPELGLKNTGARWQWNGGNDPLTVTLDSDHRFVFLLRPGGMGSTSDIGESVIKTSKVQTSSGYMIECKNVADLPGNNPKIKTNSSVSSNSGQASLVPYSNNSTNSYITAYAGRVLTQVMCQSFVFKPVRQIDSTDSSIYIDPDGIHVLPNVFIVRV